VQQDGGLKTIDAGAGKFKGIEAFPDQMAMGIARRAQGTQGDGLIEQLQAAALTRTAGKGHGDLAGLQSVEPEPDQEGDGEQREKFSRRHGEHDKPDQWPFIICP